ncbi:MAG: RND family transporter [Candidatus Binatia bacterium]
MRSLNRRHLTQRYLYFLLRHRFGVCVGVLLGTLLFGYSAFQLRIHTDFFDLYPPSHPYIKLYNQYRHLMGTANVLQLVLEVEHGTIYTTDTLKKIDALTRALMDSRGVNPFQVISLTHPKVRDITISTSGITALPIVRRLPESEDELQKIREKVYSNVGVRGIHVSLDDKAALITAGLWEEGTDFAYLWQRVDQLLTTYHDDNTRLYVTGYPMLYAWVQYYYPTILLVIALTAAIIAVLLGFYFHTLIGVLVPLFSGLLSALWALGFAGLCGFRLDPLVLVVFVLITARALSHSVQSMERFHEEYHRLGDKQAAIVSSYLSLFDPAFVSIGADALALLTLAVARIPVIQNLAFVASFWILTIVVSVITLHPVLLTFLPPPYRDPKAGTRLSDRFYTRMCHMLVWLSREKRRYVSVVILVFSLLLGGYFSHKLQVGTVSIGEALMYPQHPYSIATRKVTEKFIGTSQMIVMVEGKIEHALKQEAVLMAIEKFQWHMKQHGAAGSVSATTTIKRVFRLLHEGDPNWEILPTRQQDIDTSFFLVSGNPELVRLIADRYRNTPITLYYRTASNAEAKRALLAAKEFIAAHPQEDFTFRLAGGLIGILAAVQEEVERSYRYNLVLVLIAVFIFSYLTYRSVVGALIVMLPSIIAQPLTEAFMYLANIDMNISSLPVAAVGIGIGIDYGYYVLSRIIEEYAVCRDFDEANHRALFTTGKAVFFTGTTLVASVVLWVFFPMKFQAEMALLLSLILVFHVVGALIFIPAAMSLLTPRFASALGQRIAGEQPEGTALKQVVRTARSEL